MSKDFRLKSEKDFNSVFKKGKRLYSNALTLVYLPSKEVKAGFAVSKKHGKSVVRNRIKRLLRESFRSFLPYIKENFFFVFIPKIDTEISLDNFKSSMSYLLKKGNFFEQC